MCRFWGVAQRLLVPDNLKSAIHKASFFEYAEWHLARVGIDCHVEVQGFFYSVPWSANRWTRAPPPAR